jgi:hypothetical protein
LWDVSNGLRLTDRLETDPSLKSLFDGAGGAGLVPPQLEMKKGVLPLI